MTEAGGSLKSASVIHAVAPAYDVSEEGDPTTVDDHDEALTSTYAAAMELGRAAGVAYLAFPCSLLRDPRAVGDARSAEQILVIGLSAIRASLYPELHEVHLVATDDEEEALILNVRTVHNGSTQPQPQLDPTQPQPQTQTQTPTQPNPTQPQPNPTQPNPTQPTPTPNPNPNPIQPNPTHHVASGTRVELGSGSVQYGPACSWLDHIGCRTILSGRRRGC